MNKEKTSLNGLRVLNTRPQEQGQELSQSIQQAGGIAIGFPALAIEPTPTIWLKTMPDLSTVKQAIFTSTNAVNYYFDVLKQHRIAWPQAIEVFAIGDASAKALHHWNVTVNHIPSIADSECLLKLEALQHPSSQNLLLIKGEGGRELIPNTLSARGAHVTPLSVYRRTLPQVTQHQINSLWQDDQVDIILFTSQQAIRHIFSLFGANARAWLCSKPCLVISNRLAAEAASFGIKTVLTCHHDTILDALEKQAFT